MGHQKDLGGYASRPRAPARVGAAASTRPRHVFLVARLPKSRRLTVLWCGAPGPLTRS